MELQSFPSWHTPGALLSWHVEWKFAFVLNRTCENMGEINFLPIMCGFCHTSLKLTWPRNSLSVHLDK